MLIVSGLSDPGRISTESDIPKVIAEAKRDKILFGQAETQVPRRLRISGGAAAGIELLQHAIKNGFIRIVYPVWKSFSLLRMSTLPMFCSSCLEAIPTLRRIIRGFALKTGEDLSGVPWYPKELSIRRAEFQPRCRSYRIDRTKSAISG
jgi:hypothetical protein